MSLAQLKVFKHLLLTSFTKDSSILQLKSRFVNYILVFKTVFPFIRLQCLWGDAMKFSDKLRNLIEERNLTQKKVANDLNIAPSTMGGYVQGSSEPDFDTLRRIAEYFNVSTDYLLGVKSTNCNCTGEDELLRIFRSLTNTQQNIFIEQGKVFVRCNESKT